MTSLFRSLKARFACKPNSHLRITRWSDDVASYEQVDNLDTGLWWVNETRKVPYPDDGADGSPAVTYGA